MDVCICLSEWPHRRLAGVGCVCDPVYVCQNMHECVFVCARPLCIHKFIRYSLTHTRVAEPRQVSSMRIKSGYAHVVYTYLYIFDAYRVKLCTCYIHMHIHI